MSGVQRASGTTSMIDVAVLFAEQQQQEVKTIRDQRDAAFASEIQNRESALGDERDSAELRLAAGVCNAAATAGNGLFQIGAGATADKGSSTRLGGGGQVWDAGMKAVGVGLQFSAETAGFVAREKGLAADRAKARREDLTDSMHEAKRLRDSFVSQMKQAMDDEKRTHERIRA